MSSITFFLHIAFEARQRRPHYTKFMNFEDKEVPTEPYPEAIEKLGQKLKDSSKLEDVQKVGLISFAGM